MAAGVRKTDRERLNWAIDLLGDWKAEYTWAEVEHVFMYLNELDQSKNLDLWEELRRVMGSNEALHERELLRFLRSDTLAGRGYWWFAPDHWAPVKA